MKRAVLFACLMVSVACIGAQSGFDMSADISRQRDALSQERARITLEHDQMAKDCWQKFSVNDCLSAVRKSRRAQLDPIHQKELELNAQERVSRTQLREERLKSKQVESGGSHEQ